VNKVATSENNEFGPIIGMMMAIMMLAMFTQLFGCAPAAKLSGHVRDSEGNPVDEAQLNINGLTYTTIADGYYEFTGLTPGTFSLEVVNAEDLGFEPKPSMSVNPTAGDNIKDIILTVPTTGANLVGVVRHYTTLDLMEEVSIILNGQETTTNIYGLYSFHDVEPGDYTLTVSKDGFDTKVIDVTLALGDNTLDIILVPEGLPVAEFEVSDLSITPAEVSVGGTVEISALVTNIGDAAGTHTVNCNITPATFTPLEVVPAAVVIPWSDIINVVVLVVFMKVVVGMVSEAR